MSRVSRASPREPKPKAPAALGLEQGGEREGEKEIEKAERE